MWNVHCAHSTYEFEIGINDMSNLKPFFFVPFFSQCNRSSNILKRKLKLNQFWEQKRPEERKGKNRE